MWRAPRICAGAYIVCILHVPAWRHCQKSWPILSLNFYADDTQLYWSFKLHDQAPSVQAIESCLNDIDAWMLANMLKPNRSRDKTELLVIGPKHKINPSIKGIHVAGEYIEVSNNARNIGVIFGSHVNLEKHVMNT